MAALCWEQDGRLFLALLVSLCRCWRSWGWRWWKNFLGAYLLFQKSVMVEMSREDLEVVERRNASEAFFGLCLLFSLLLLFKTQSSRTLVAGALCWMEIAPRSREPGMVTLFRRAYAIRGVSERQQGGPSSRSANQSTDRWTVEKTRWAARRHDSTAVVAIPFFSSVSV